MSLNLVWIHNRYKLMSKQFKRKSMNRINIIGCGGCGVSIAGNLTPLLRELGEGFSDIKTSYIDTSDSDVLGSFMEEDVDSFFQIESIDHDGATIDGSGGERRTNVPHIQAGVGAFLDKKKITKKVTGEIYVVIAAASGGSGSVISPILTKKLIERNIPTVVVLIGDSSSGLQTRHTVNTLASFDSVAKITKKPLSIMYVNNANLNEGDMLGNMAKADKLIFQSLASLSAMLSGDNISLDYQDIVSLIDQSFITSIQIPAGLYGLSLFTGKIMLPKTSVIKGVRTLIHVDSKPDLNIFPDHHIFGTVVSKNVIGKFKDQLPLHLVTHANFFATEEKLLKEKLSGIDEKLDSATVDALSGARDTETTDDGLVL